MKTATEDLRFETKTKRELINVTDTVARIVAESGVREGTVLVTVKAMGE